MCLLACCLFVGLLVRLFISLFAGLFNIPAATGGLIGNEFYFIYKVCFLSCLLFSSLSCGSPLSVSDLCQQEAQKGGQGAARSSRWPVPDFGGLQKTLRNQSNLINSGPKRSFLSIFH